MLLEPIRKAEGIIQLKALKNIQTTTKHYLPTRVGCDVSIMLGAASVVGPTELDANTRTSISDLLQAFGLTITIGIILNGHHMNHHLIFRALQLANGLHQLHQVAQLVEHTKIGVCDDDVAWHLPDRD